MKRDFPFEKDGSVVICGISIDFPTELNTRKYDYKVVKENKTTTVELWVDSYVTENNAVVRVANKISITNRGKTLFNDKPTKQEDSEKIKYIFDNLKIA